jgi:hypothetical protein
MRGSSLGTGGGAGASGAGGGGGGGGGAAACGTTKAEIRAGMGIVGWTISIGTRMSAPTIATCAREVVISVVRRLVRVVRSCWREIASNMAHFCSLATQVPFNGREPHSGSGLGYARTLLLDAPATQHSSTSPEGCNPCGVERAPLRQVEPPEVVLVRLSPPQPFLLLARGASIPVFSIPLQPADLTESCCQAPGATLPAALRARRVLAFWQSARKIEGRDCIVLFTDRAHVEPAPADRVRLMLPPVRSLAPRRLRGPS